MTLPSDRTIGGAADARRPPDASLLAEITADLGAGHDVEPLLRRFLLPIVTLAGTQAGAVRVFCDETQRLRLVGHIGLAPGVAQAETLVDRHCGVCGVAADGWALAWSQAAGDCKLHGVRASGVAGGACAHVLAVPLAHRGRMLGVCTCSSRPQRAPTTACRRCCAPSATCSGSRSTTCGLNASTCARPCSPSVSSWPPRCTTRSRRR